MAKSELYGNSLIPLVLVAGILSGGLWRSSAPAESGKGGESSNSGVGDKSDAARAPVSWISDLRPALESLDGALGAHADSAGESPLLGPGAIAIAAKGAVRDKEVLEAMDSLRTRLNDLSTGADAATCNAAALEKPAEVLGAWMLADGWDGGTPRAAEAKALLEEYRNWQLFAGLATRVKESQRGSGHPRYSVGFVVATIPDYVDSNSGWLADQGLAAVQSGMAQARYLFDRVKLIDWSRVSGGPTAASASRLHERQPGVIIFRRVGSETSSPSVGADGMETISLEVVLTVLETATAGVHQVALRNSLRFLRAWNACSGSTSAPLRILGPSFSGSTVSLAMVLGEAPFATSFPRRVVITGSATADENLEKMTTFSHGAIFKATVQPTSVLKAMMADYLQSINSRWTAEHIALLNESNTAYGNANSTGPPSRDSAIPEDPFAGAKIFNFPLHISQLRSDAPSLEQPGAALISGSVVPLNLREAVPPSDAIPALRPQLTSPVVESTVDSILDAIRHEKISAVGIFATDDRDVLFLARKLKLAAPDVQLFLFGTHALYLHPDYVPYVRGALVASSYALTLANQPEIRNLADGFRQPFQSMVSEGVFYATRALLSLQNDGRIDPLPYCGADVVLPANARLNCVPVAPASINVIGEDGYWTLIGPNDRKEQAAQAANAKPLSAGAVPPPSPLHVALLPPLPLRFWIGGIFVLVIVLVHLWVVIRIKAAIDSRGADQSFLERPLVRVLVPPRTFERAAGRHRFATTICFALLSLAAASVVAIGLPFLLRDYAGQLVMPAAVLGTCITVLYTGVKCYGTSRMLRFPLIVDRRVAGKRPPPIIRRIALKLGRLTTTEWTGWVLFGGMLVTMGLFLVLAVGIAATSGEEGRLTLARIAGGGIVSPAALTLFLALAFYTAVFTGVRRLSLVGFGYECLEGRSAAFRLLTAARDPQSGEPRQGSLAGMLDMPMENMPSVYPAAVLLILLVAVISTVGVTTIDGWTFSWFLKVGTWTTLGLGLLQLAQGLALWHTARSHLKRLAQTPIEKHLQDIAPAVPWDISLVPPRLTELMPVAHMADGLIRDFRRLALAGRHGAAGSRLRRDLGSIAGIASEEETRIGVRPGDLVSLRPLFADASYVNALETEMQVREHAAIIQSDSWFALWRLSDTFVTMLQSTVWRRTTTTISALSVRQEAAVATPAKGVPLMTSDLADAALEDIELPHSHRSVSGSTTEWFGRCEQLVALQMAFVLRDIVARTITCLFAAMVCLTSLTTSHLLYVFSGRTSLLTIDMLAIGATALSAVWILVDMERDHVLSRLRTTTPGRVDINWEFIKRIAVYGVLPLLAVIAALFPEVGGTLFGWLEPLRKLSSL